MSGKDGFGPRLRTIRERRGLTLDSIARTTKIKASLLSELERNDVSHWPAGIFRRAFLRSYASALGIPSEPLLADFQRYFPEDGLPDPAPWQDDEEPMPAPRLTLALDSDEGRELGMRGLSAALELAVVLAIAAGLSGVVGTGFWATAGVTALLYYPLATALTARTPRWRSPRWSAGSPSRRQLVEDVVEDAPDTYDVERLDETDQGSEATRSPAEDEFRPSHTAFH